MIKATFYKSGDKCFENLYVGFDIKGHSGYADAGSDIVCASVSSMVMLFVNMADSFKIPFDFSSDEETAHISFMSDSKDKNLSVALICFMDCVKSVSEDYPEFVEVREKKV